MCSLQTRHNPVWDRSMHAYQLSSEDVWSLHLLQCGWTLDQCAAQNTLNHSSQYIKVRAGMDTLRSRYQHAVALAPHACTRRRGKDPQLAPAMICSCAAQPATPWPDLLLRRAPRTSCLLCDRLRAAALVIQA
jgi:hypothetical protein